MLQGTVRLIIFRSKRAIAVTQQKRNQPNSYEYSLEKKHLLAKDAVLYVMQLLCGVVVIPRMQAHSQDAWILQEGSNYLLHLGFFQSWPRFPWKLPQTHSTIQGNLGQKGPLRIQCLPQAGSISKLERPAQDHFLFSVQYLQAIYSLSGQLGSFSHSSLWLVFC